jgi:von Willebrand factor type D domain
LPLLPRLLAGQRRVIERRLGIRPGSPHAAHHVSSQHVSLCVTCTYGDPSFKEDPALQAVADTWVADYAAQLGPLGMAVVVGTASQPPGKAADFADSLPMTSTSGGIGAGNPTVCRIRMFPKSHSIGAAGQGWVLAHEVFHCFEYQILGANAWQGQPAGWVEEGLASWAAWAVDPVLWGPSPQVSSSLQHILNYIGDPRKQLFTRLYDAVGFWLHLSDVSGPLWSRIPDILKAGMEGGSSEAAFVASGANTGAFLDSWGSSIFRAQPQGANWDMVCPCSAGTSAGFLPSFADLKPGQYQNLPGTGPVEAPAYGTSQYEIDGGLPVVHVEIRGHARLGVDENYIDLENAWFCTTAPGTCVCPAGTTGTIPPTQSLDPDAKLGLTGDPGTGTVGGVTSYPLSHFCNSPPTACSTATGASDFPTQHLIAQASGQCAGPGPVTVGPGSAPPGGGAASSFMDPHMIDFDRDVFDFQGAGEFTLLKSTQDDFQVQVRQQPFKRSRSVAVNTAVVIRMGTATVEIDSLGGSAIAVYLNKVRTHASSVALGGGHLTVQGPNVTMRLRDGSTALISSEPGAYLDAPALNLNIQLVRHRRGHVDGLLGNWGVPAAAEFVGRNGRHYPQSAIIDGNDPKALYSGYGNSWRITQRNSLFRYARGKDTGSYTIRGFPRKYVTTSSLSPSQQLAGEQACKRAGVTNAGVFAACVLDVGATGDPGFAAGNKSFQTTAGLASAVPAKLSPIDLGIGSAQPRIAHDPGSGDTYVAWVGDGGTSIDLCSVTTAAPTCNGGAGPDRLVDPPATVGGADPQYFYPQLVVQPGGRVVVLAELDGASASVNSPGYGVVGIAAWSSPAGGAAFGSADQGIADGGMLLVSSSGTGDAPSGGAIALDPTDIGVYGDEFPFGSGFAELSLGQPAPSTNPIVDSTGDFGDQIGTTGTQLASVPDPSAPGEYMVVAVGGDASTPLGCPAGSGEAAGYGVGVGTPAALQTQAAWSSKYFAPTVCHSFSPTLAGGGPSGGAIGLLEDEGLGLSGAGSDGVYYRRFDPATSSFGAPALVSNETTVASGGASELSVSQESDGDAYAAWLDSRGWMLSYSSSAGASWPTPVAIPIASSAADAVIAGAGGGSADLGYTANLGAGAHEYLVPLSYSQLAGG